MIWILTAILIFNTILSAQINDGSESIIQKHNSDGLRNKKYFAEKNIWVVSEYRFPLQSCDERDSSGDEISFRQIYSFLVSDHDGDNCPFHPSCSQFALSAISEYGVIKGLLMYGDRFQREMNLFKTKSDYPEIYKGRLYDPTQKYSLKLFDPGKRTND